jgi:predicted nuclease of predicted toxin-antitoxin system
MIILLDECVPRRYLRLLEEWGHQAEAASAHVAADASDGEVIALATKLDATLLTIVSDGRYRIRR